MREALVYVMHNKLEPEAMQSLPVAQMLSKNDH